MRDGKTKNTKAPRSFDLEAYEDTQTAQWNFPSKVFADFGSSKLNKFNLVNSREVNRFLKAATPNSRASTQAIRFHSTV
jgi:hypothetical protein